MNTDSILTMYKGVGNIVLRVRENTVLFYVYIYKYLSKTIQCVKLENNPTNKKERFNMQLHLINFVIVISLYKHLLVLMYIRETIEMLK